MTYGHSLDTFFNDWVYQKGFPVYQVKWYQTGTQTIIKLLQTTTHSSVSCFRMPVEIRLRSAAGDTTVKVYNDQNEQTFVFNWANPLLTLGGPVLIDPNNYIPNSILPALKDSTLLSVLPIVTADIKVYPNPTGTTWTVENIPHHSKLRLLDMKGQIHWQIQSIQSILQVPEMSLPAGTYILEVERPEGTQLQIKLLKL
jgi:hypothetical protein